MDPSRRVVLVAFDGLQSLDLIGPNEVFAAAARLVPGSYSVEVVAPQRRFRSWSGVRMEADTTLAGCRGAIDTLIVAGGEGVRTVQEDERLIAWLRRAAPRTRRMASVCTGAFLLARAGLLDGREATTHWASCAELARLHPSVHVQSDPIFVRSGSVYTSAGVTAGIDLALALVEEDLGPKVARDVARWLVLFLRRPGGQSQFSAALAGQRAEREPLRELQAWMVDHLDEDLSVPALAERAYMSPRNFARAFKREVGMTPAAYVETLRVERARALLETAGEGVEQVALRCGFGTVETMRRVFRRRLGVSPGDYRERFQRRAA
ncbi:MAG TPA: GlxA family transcriptional regulator [Thermoleophilaceae bacterium]|nr:GlxA family transcriptional regulator [Thermoleophilaceae bacterium]